ncbi:UNVERIFIED_CONTAM: hypothetical protein K2H54_009827 [Gekko kuhli]
MSADLGRHWPGPGSPPPSPETGRVVATTKLRSDHQSPRAEREGERQQDSANSGLAQGHRRVLRWGASSLSPRSSSGQHIHFWKPSKAPMARDNCEKTPHTHQRIRQCLSSTVPGEHTGDHSETTVNTGTTHITGDNGTSHPGHQEKPRETDHSEHFEQRHHPHYRTQ